VREGESLTVGRDPECGLVLEDPRVSKLHARVQWDGEGWRLEDLGSKNGTSVNGAPATECSLASESWISFGGVTGRFDRLSDEDARALDAHRQARLQTSRALRDRLGAHLEPADLLLRLLESAMDVVGAKRGFVLLMGPEESLSVELAAGYTPAGLNEDDQRFAGSLGAVQRALETGASVVVSDAQADPYLGKRPSVVTLGLGAVGCVPIRHDDRILGLLYVDSPTPRAGFSELDLEILEGLADHTAVAIASIQLDEKLQRLIGESNTAAADGPVLQELQRRIGQAVKFEPSEGPAA
jgi:transcriptional regulator with GAF, ATPase, and Fis domain